MKTRWTGIWRRRLAVQRRRLRRRRKEPAGYRMRRERLGEWAVALVLALMAGLWLCWPKGSYRARVPARLPEPGAAYVIVEHSSSPLMQRPDRLAHQGRDGGGVEPLFSLLPAVPPPSPPSPPPYTDMAVVPPELPPARVPRLAPAPLVVGPRLDPLPGAPVVRERIVKLSPALQAAGFRFTEPGGLAGEAGRICFRVLLGADGRVAALLDEAPGENADARLAWRRALLPGTGTNSAAGVVEAEW